MELPKENGTHDQSDSIGADQPLHINGESIAEEQPVAVPVTPTAVIEIDPVDILRNLEAHIGAKRELLVGNEDELDSEAAADLSERRMNFARHISPIKKVPYISCIDFLTIKY